MNLYRGFLDPVSSGLLENNYLRTPRRPRDSHIHVHQVADDWFYSKFGIRARSQTIFCTSDLSQAKQYGTPYKISIPDYVDCRFLFSIHVNDFNEIEVEINDVNNKKEIVNWLESKEYKLVACREDIPSDFDGEIMIFCEKYEVLEI